MNILGKQQSKLNMDVGIVIIQLFLEVSLLKRAVLATGTMVKNIEAGNSFFLGGVPCKVLHRNRTTTQDILKG